MFMTADWTQPQIGGLLSEVIEKEERQLREPKPRREVKHVWDPKALTGRATTWEDVRPAPQGSMADARSKLGMSVPNIDDSQVRSRSRMLADRRTRESLSAMDRERAADAASTDKGFKSAASLFTPSDLSSMRPTYAPNEAYATATTNMLIGYGAKRVPPAKSRYNRQPAYPPDFTDSKNGPDRTIVEKGMAETCARAKPWLTDPAPPVPVPMPASHIFPRSTTSNFCMRPHEYPNKF
mmetsp:Transcript_1295/g.3664  ORF Transcript_1295/g.3664 Transcript_1295/m.3664 type:complete len:238 (-) Transcript_1295:272-985(-)